MGWFEAFSTEGTFFPAVMIAFGSLVVLRAPSTRKLTEDEIHSAPVGLRWLARLNSTRLQLRCGWAIIVYALFIAVVRIAQGR